MSLFEGKLFLSTDGAATFTERALTLPDGLPQRAGRGDNRGGQDRLYTTPGKEGDLWIAAFNGLYHSTDSGATFVRMDGVSEVHAFGFGKAAPGADYRGAVPGGRGQRPARRSALDRHGQKLGANQRRPAPVGPGAAGNGRSQAIWPGLRGFARTRHCLRGSGEIARKPVVIEFRSRYLELILRRLEMNVALRTTLVATLLAVGGALSTQAIAQDRKPPQVLDLSKLKFQIVDATFVSSLDAGEGKFQETSPEKYRGMVLTVKITKPAERN